MSPKKYFPEYAQEITSLEFDYNVVKCKCDNCTVLTEESFDLITIKTINCENCLSFLKELPPFVLCNREHQFSFHEFSKLKNLTFKNLIFDRLNESKDALYLPAHTVTNFKMINCNSTEIVCVDSKFLQSVELKDCASLVRFISKVNEENKDESYNFEITNCLKLVGADKHLQGSNILLDSPTFIEKIYGPKHGWTNKNVTETTSCLEKLNREEITA